MQEGEDLSHRKAVGIGIVEGDKITYKGKKFKSFSEWITQLLLDNGYSPKTRTAHKDIIIVSKKITLQKYKEDLKQHKSFY